MRVRVGTARARWRDHMSVSAVGVELSETSDRHVVSMNLGGENVTPIALRMTVREAEALAQELIGAIMQARMQNDEDKLGPKKERL